MAISSSYELLHSSVKKWIYQQNWHGLRPIQEVCIPLIIEGGKDVVISANTATGKTEAAFLPIVSILASSYATGIQALCISPLKALINDQYRRLESLFQGAEVNLTPWHGDISASVKNKLRRNPKGALMITPESLEALLFNDGKWCDKNFVGLQYVVIDEFHAFIGSERGIQLCSQLHRIEMMIGRKIPRIALSATLGDVNAIPSALRPSGDYPFAIPDIENPSPKVRLKIHGYIKGSNNNKSKSAGINEIPEELINDLFSHLRGHSNLVFTNSRSTTEEISFRLSQKCQELGVPIEFFPHHGNLSKDLRSDLEEKLQQENVATTAICTSTLELGIDVGKIDIVGQVCTPYSVSSLRQRLGRSGRRADSASSLRFYIVEESTDNNSNIANKLSYETFQAIAMVYLMLHERWFEPPNKQSYHLSTLVQQTLSVIGQYGGVRAKQLYELLCKTGPFNKVNSSQYAMLLKAMGEKQVLTQTSDGQLVLGVKGEKIVSHYSFYSAFSTSLEFRLEYQGHIIGKLPVSKILNEEELIIFAGKSWKVQAVDYERKLILLKPSSEGKVAKFDGGTGCIHGRIRQTMYQLYCQQFMPDYLNQGAKENAKRGLQYFHQNNLKQVQTIQTGKDINILSWEGDVICETITLLLNLNELKTFSNDGIITVQNCNLLMLITAFSQIVSSPKTIEEITHHIPDILADKHDALIPLNLRQEAYAKSKLELSTAYKWIDNFLSRQTNSSPPRMG